MSYLKMLGLARGKAAGAAGLFSTAVISGSSSAPNLRVCIPSSATNNTALEGFGGVPAIRPLETLHNALSLRQLDVFLERVTAAPVLLGTPPAPPPTPPAKPASPTNSVGWSGPSSLMSSSGELPSALSSAGPSSPNSNYASNSDHKNSESNWSKNVASKLPQWDGEAATLCGADAGLPPYAHHPGSSVSGDVTPVSLASELEFNSNEATAGSITDHDLMSAEGEDDEETLSTEPHSSSPLRFIRNELAAPAHKLHNCRASTSHAPDCTPDLHKSKDNVNSININIDSEKNNKYAKVDSSHYLSNLNSLNDTGKNKNKKNELMNNGSRRYSDSSAQKSNAAGTVAGSRFTTTLVAEDLLRPSTSKESKSNNNLPNVPPEVTTPSVTKANNAAVKPGFTITDD